MLDEVPKSTSESVTIVVVGDKALIPWHVDRKIDAASWYRWAQDREGFRPPSRPDN